MDYQFGKNKSLNIENRYYLNVVYALKESAKKWGAKYDAELKQWYVEKSNENFNKLVICFGPKKKKNEDI